MQAHRRCRRTSSRRGSVLLIVIALLGILLLVGIAFISFTSQEEISAEYYADSAKNLRDPSLSSDVLFDWALSQLIVGTESTDPLQRTSALWSSRHALIPAMFGTDTAVYNGRRIVVKTDSNGAFFVDMNNDGTPDNTELLQPNYSYPAQQANGGSYNGFPTAFAPDPDFTYPGLDAPFLAYIGTGLDSSGNDVDVILPSFHLPQLMRNPSNGQPFTDWQTNPQTARLSFRAHPEHKTVSNANPLYIRTTDSPVMNALGNPVAAFPFAAATSQGVWNQSPNTVYVWDVDNDGDGTKEGVWLHLGFPAQQLGDGRFYVPMFSYTVIDADGLLNLNVHGTIGGATSLNDPFGNGRFISRSNQGLARSEVSPLWGLWADPTSSTFTTTATNDTRQHNIFFGRDPSMAGTMSRTTMANMEYLFSLWGRAEFINDGDGSFGYNAPGIGQVEPESYLLGRWGELSLLQQGVNSLRTGTNASLFPAPGRKSIDDNRDYTAQGGFTPGRAYQDPTYGLIYPAVIHPFDLVGNGNYLQSTATGRTVVGTGLSLSAPANPSRWLTYIDGFEDPGRYAETGYITYRDAGDVSGSSSILFNAYRTQGTLDDPSEVIEEPSLKPAGDVDGIFGPEENFALQASDTDFSNANESSRLRDLLPFNFQLNNKAADIRKQYTVNSRDRAQFGLPDDIRRLRAWEFNADADNDGFLEFPPVFGQVDPMTMMLVAANPPPIRNELRQLLRVELNDTNVNDRKLQLRLNINSVLTGFQNYQGRILPTYRPLTPHPVNLDSGLVPTSAPYPPTTPQEQEYWARYDRQMLCRDIFVLLYVLGGGNDGVNYASTPGAYPADTDTLGPNYDAALSPQVKEMAQFAVNMVDAMDRDNVTTAFEFDYELTNGWSVDDNAFTGGPSAPHSSPSGYDTERRVVYGVEAQQLTISEGLVVQSKQHTTQNSPVTLYNDTENERYYTFLELRNAAPFNVDLSTGAWRIRRLDIGSPLPTDPGAERRVQLLNGTVSPGGIWTIGSSDGTDTFTNTSSQVVHRASDFRVDHNVDNMTWERIIPNVAEASGLEADEERGPGCNTDLVHDSHYGMTYSDAHHWVTVGSSGSRAVRGDLIKGVGQLAGDITFVLERRLHLSRTRGLTFDDTYEKDNPWVEVDRMSVPTHVFQVDSSTSQTDLEMAGMSGASLPKLRSKERSEPFARSNGENQHQPNTDLRGTSVGTISNSNAPGAHTIWQPHFDRDFTSVYELLTIPLYGPDTVTSDLRLSQDFMENRKSRTGWLMQGCELSAAKKFLRPQWVNHSNGATPGADYDNRWYRVLELLEVPSRTHLSIQAQLGGPRIPGAINLNTLRHRAVLAGLIDDQDDPNTGGVEGHLNTDFDANNLATMLQDRYGESDTAHLPNEFEQRTRDWWQQFLFARDGEVPNGNHSLGGAVLPGLPHSKPFRSMMFAADVNDPKTSIEHTLLRKLPYDANLMSGAFAAADRRHIFEARTQSDLATQGGSNLVDLHTRYRLLRKLANNSTTRSHVFHAFISVGFFEAVEVDDGSGGKEYRVGAKLAGTPDVRGFFVIDRSLPEQGYNQSTGKFDFRKFVLYRKTLQ